MIKRSFASAEYALKDARFDFYPMGALRASLWLLIAMSNTSWSVRQNGVATTG